MVNISESCGKRRPDDPTPCFYPDCRCVKPPSRWKRLLKWVLIAALAFVGYAVILDILPKLLYMVLL